jgi:hypothetical protein
MAPLQVLRKNMLAERAEFLNQKNAGTLSERAQRPLCFGSEGVKGHTSVRRPPPARGLPCPSEEM